MLLRLKEDFINIITRYAGMNNWIKDTLDKDVVEIIG